MMGKLWKLPNMTLIGKKKVLLRCEQDSNLRGETPLDFKSNALTTRPSQQNVKDSGQTSYSYVCTVALHI